VIEGLGLRIPALRFSSLERFFLCHAFFPQNTRGRFATANPLRFRQRMKESAKKSNISQVEAMHVVEKLACPSMED